MAHLITKGSISRMYDFPKDTNGPNPVIQVINVKQIKSAGSNLSSVRYRLIISDGEFYQQAMLTTRLNDRISSGEICKGCLLELSEFICNEVQSRRIIIIMAANVKSGEHPRIGNPQNIEKRGKGGPTRGSSNNAPPQPKPVQGGGAPSYNRGNTNGNTNGASYGGQGNQNQGNGNRNQPGTAGQQNKSSSYNSGNQNQGGNTGQQNTSSYNSGGGQNNNSGRNAGGGAYGGNQGQNNSGGQNYGNNSNNSNNNTTTQQRGGYNAGQNRGGSGGGGYGGGGRSGGGPVQKINADSDTYIPISQLNPYRSSWTIKARITNKGDVRTWSNARGEGCLMSIDLLDSQGSEVRGTFFKEAVEKFKDLLQENQVYSFSGGRIKMANKKYSSLNCEYEITFNQYSEIKQLENDRSIKTRHFDFTPLKELADLEPGVMVDVIGVIHKDYGCQPLTTKAGKEMKKRNLDIVDSSGTCISVTFWNEKAEKELGDYSRHPVLAMKGIKLSDWNGRSLGTYGSSTCICDPEIQDAFNLRGWYDANAKTTTFNSLSTQGGGGSKGTGEIKPIASILGDNLGHNEKPDWIDVKATLMYVKTDRAWYEACTNQREGRQCNKKVIAVTGDLDGPYSCEKCNAQLDRCQRRYILSAQFSDATGKQWMTVFNDMGEKLMGGKTADDLNLLMESDHQQYKDLFQAVCFEQYQMTLRVKAESVNDELRIKAVVQSIKTIDYVAESARLLGEIDKLLG